MCAGKHTHKFHRLWWKRRVYTGGSSGLTEGYEMQRKVFRPTALTLVLKQIGLLAVFLSISLVTCTLSAAVSLPGSFTVTPTAECNGSSPQIRLNWTVSTGAASYDVYRDGSLYSSGVTGTQFINTSVSGGTTYSYYVRAQNSAGGTNSNTVLATAPSSCGGCTTLTNNVPVANLAGALNAQTCYQIAVPAGQTQLTVSISGGTGDADLYVKYGSPPTLSSYGCRPWVPGNNETCTFPSPASETWYIMINGYSAYTGVSLVAGASAGSVWPIDGVVASTCFHVPGSGGASAEWGIRQIRRHVRAGP